MSVNDDLLASLPAEDVALRDVRVGPFWTVVWTEQGAGLASTQRDAHTPHGHSLIRWAGDVMAHSARELAELLRAKSPMEAALGMATVNALLEVDGEALIDRNASEEIIQRGEGKRVVIIGHFPILKGATGSGPSRRAGARSQRRRAADRGSRPGNSESRRGSHHRHVVGQQEL